MEDNEEKHLRSVALANAQALLRARERAEEALRASEEQFRAVFNQTTGGIAQTDLTGRFTLINDRYCDIVGRSREELLSLRMQDITHPDDASANAEQFRALVQGGPSFVVEERYVRPDGSIVWVHNDVSAMRDSRGHVSHAVAAVTDITERKQTEQQLHHSEQELADFFENATVGLHWVGPDGIILRANRAELNLLGYAADEYVGHHIAEFHADQDAIGDILRRLTEGEELHGYEARLRCKDGSVRHVLISSNVLWEDDRFVHTRCFTRDITERKQAEKALRESETYTRQLLDSSPDCVKVLDLDGRLISINPAGLKMLEVSDDASLLNHDWTEFWTDADRAAARQALVTARNGETASFLGVCSTSTGKSKWWDVILSPVLDSNRKPKQILAVSRDITDRKRAEEALHRLNDELEQRVAERTQKLAQSEDRLRALATELNLAEQRERKRLAVELHDHLQQTLVLGRLIAGQGKRMAVTAPPCLDVMKKMDDIFSEALTYTRTLVADLSPPVLRDHGLPAALKWLGEYMKKHQIAVTVTVPEKDDLKLPEDQVVVLFQSARELLINSAKHAGTRQADVRLERYDGQLRIEVSDQGAGFDPVVAAASAGTPNGGISSKFGLFSIQERMRALGGSFNIQSTPGKGTTAALTLPIRSRAEVRDTTNKERHVSGRHRDGDAAVSLPATPDSAPKKNSKIRVLLVDDHPMMRQGLRSIVTAYDHLEVVGEAGDGAEAVKLAQRLDPDVVVMDINMPRMDGIEATQRIKTNQPTTVVIGLSVNQSTDTEQKMKAAGASTYLTKESAVDALCHAIEQAVSYKQRTAACLVD